MRPIYRVSPGSPILTVALAADCYPVLDPAASLQIWGLCPAEAPVLVLPAAAVTPSAELVFVLSAEWQALAAGRYRGEVITACGRTTIELQKGGVTRLVAAAAHRRPCAPQAACDQPSLTAPPEAP